MNPKLVESATLKPSPPLVRETGAVLQRADHTLRLSYESPTSYRINCVRVPDNDEERARVDAATAALESLLRLGAPYGGTEAAISAWFDERVLPMSECAQAAVEAVATVLYEEQEEARWVSDTEQAMLLSLSEQ